LPSIISAMPRNSAQQDRTAAIIRRHPVARPHCLVRGRPVPGKIKLILQPDDPSRAAVAPARSSG
jgi:hypothetical protein